MALAASAPAAGEDSPWDAWTDRQKEEFLARAKITASELLAVGVTGSRRATLALGEHVHDAHIQTIDVFKKKEKLGPRTEINFRDSYLYNIAAYRLDRMLGLEMVPVSIPRRIKRENAAVTWWVDNVMMSERDRVAKNLHPPRAREWNQQINRALVFDQLVYNIDFNRSNLLITDDWRVWLIDFTRAFRAYRKLREPETLLKIDGRLLESLEQLEESSLRERMSDVLTRPEIRGILSRRDAIVEHFERRIEQLGADQVLDEAAPPDSG